MIELIFKKKKMQKGLQGASMSQWRKVSVGFSVFWALPEIPQSDHLQTLAMMPYS